MSRFPRPGRTPRPRPVPTAGPTPSPTPGPGTTFTLTTNIETLPAAGQTAAPNAVFTANAGGTINGPLDTLQSGDVLNGSGGTNVLNAVLVGANGAGVVQAPTIRNIPTVNISTITAGSGLNAGLSSGITTIGNLNSTAATAVTNLTSAVGTINISGGTGAGTQVQAQANVLAGAADSVQVNLSGQAGGNINLASIGASATNGYDTVNIASTGSNTIGAVSTAGSADALVLTGAGLNIAGTAGGAALNGSANAIDASLATINGGALTGALNIGTISNQGAAFTGASVVAPAGAVALNFTGSNAGTTLFVQAANLDANDTLRGGTVADVLTLTGASGGAVAAVGSTANAPTISGFETLNVTDTDGEGAIDAVNFNLANTTGVITYGLFGGNDDEQVTFNNVVYAAPVNVVARGTGAAGAQDVNSPVFNFTAASVAGLNNVLNYTYGNQGVAIGNAAVTSAAFSANGIEDVNITLNNLSTDVVNNNVVTTEGSKFRVGAAGGAGLFTAATSDSVRNFNLTAAGGSASVADSIELGTIGGAAGTVRTAVVNAAGATSAVFNQANGAIVQVAGAGNHVVTLNTIFGAELNGGTGTGALTLTGNAGQDGITGGTGNDTLRGVGGNDVLSANAGADRFTFETSFALNGTDNVTGFTLGQGDNLTFAFGVGDNIAQADLRGTGAAAQRLAAAAALGTNTGLVIGGADLANAAAVELYAEGLTGENAGDIIYVLGSTDVNAAAGINTLYRVDYAGAGDAAVTTLANLGAFVLDDLAAAQITQFALA